VASCLCKRKINQRSKKMRKCKFGVCGVGKSHHNTTMNAPATAPSARAATDAMFDAFTPIAALKAVTVGAAVPESSVPVATAVVSGPATVVPNPGVVVVTAGVVGVDAPAEPGAIEVVEGGALLVVVAGPIEKGPVDAKTSLIFPMLTASRV